MARAPWLLVGVGLLSTAACRSSRVPPKEPEVVVTEEAFARPLQNAGQRCGDGAVCGQGLVCAPPSVDVHHDLVGDVCRDARTCEHAPTRMNGEALRPFGPVEWSCQRSGRAPAFCYEPWVCVRAPDPVAIAAAVEPCRTSRLALVRAFGRPANEEAVSGGRTRLRWACVPDLAGRAELACDHVYVAEVVDDLVTAFAMDGEPLRGSSCAAARAE